MSRSCFLCYNPAPMNLSRKTFSYFLFTGLILAVFTGCAGPTADQKSRLLSFGSEGTYLPQSPHVLIPGLGFTGSFWSKSKMAGMLKADGWIYGGDIHTELEPGNQPMSERKINIKPGHHIPGHFYTVTFSAPELPVIQQGRELAVMIDRIQAITGTETVVLVGHSMGGLAAREYLQSAYYGNDVRACMTVGTPHLGSNFELSNPLLKLVPKCIRNIYWKVDDTSPAVRDLRTDSIYLNGGSEKNSDPFYPDKDINANGFVGDDIVGLNEIQKHPLPGGIPYISVIGGGNAPISTMRQSRVSDGIVDIDSQDLNEVPGMNVIAFVIVSPSDHFGEANDVWTLMQAARYRQYMIRLAGATGDGNLFQATNQLPPEAADAAPF